MKVVFIPVSIVGCGKSTIFRALNTVFPRFRYIENDSCSNKSEFHTLISAAVKDQSVDAILLDRNNHLLNHRKELVQGFHKEGVLFVALLFVPLATRVQGVYDTSWERITKRGDNHPQIKGRSDVGKSKMILNSFAKNFINFDKEGPFDSSFDYVLELSTGPESSRQNIHKIVQLYREICEAEKFETTIPSLEELDSALEKSLQFMMVKGE